MIFFKLDYLDLKLSISRSGANKPFLLMKKLMPKGKN
jgi:hypothetical protein